MPHAHGTVLIDGVQSGFGGGTTWDVKGQSLPHYRVAAVERQFLFALSPVTLPSR